MRKKMKRWLSLLFLTTILGSLVYVNRLMNLKTEAAEVVVESETEILLESETVTTEESTETGPENLENEGITFKVRMLNEANSLIYGQKAVKIAEIIDMEVPEQYSEFLVADVVADASKAYTNHDFFIEKEAGMDNLYAVYVNAVAAGTVNFRIQKNTDSGGVDITVNIARRPLYLQTGDVEKHWNAKGIAESDVEVKLLNSEGYRVDDSGHKDENSGLTEYDKAYIGNKIKLPKAVIDENMCTLSQLDTIGIYPNAVTVDLDGVIADDYEFKIELQNQGTLIIDGEAVIKGTEYQYIQVDNSQSTHVYQNENHTLYIADDSNVSAKLLIQKAPYTKIIYIKEKDEEILIEDNLLSLNEGDLDQTVELVLSNDDGTKQTQPFKLVFKRDNVCPEISIKIEDVESVVKQFADAIPFKFFHNGKSKNHHKQYLQANICVRDLLDVSDMNIVEYGGSGLQAWSYLIVNTQKDINFASDKAITEANVKDLFQGYSFTNVDVEKLDKELIFDIGKVDGKVKAGNYIIFVLASDNVGNSALYSSNGVILDDVNLSSIEVVYSDRMEQGNRADFFNKAVELTATVTENVSNIFSGVKDLTYTVLEDGKRGQVQTLIDNAYPETTLESLKSFDVNGYGQKLKKFSVDVRDDRHSHEITVDFTAHDFAGNELTQTKSFVIDPVAPIVKHTVISKANKFNGKYYKDDVVVTTEITERFLDIENDVIYSIKIDEGDTKSLTLAQLKETRIQNKYGISNISVEYEENQAGKTDNTMSKITITFSEEHDYIIHTSVKDTAGNQTDKSVEEFVIDKTAPIVNVTYYRYGDGKAFVPSASEAKPTYLNEKYKVFKVSVTVNELNFNKDNYVDAKFDVAAKDFSNKIIYQESTDKIAADVQSIVQNNEVIWKVEDNDRYTYEVQFTEDANYSLAFDYTDLAGNQVIVNPVYITLDKIKPTGSVTLSGLVSGNAVETWNSFISKMTFNYFAKNSVRGSMTSEDATAGVLSTQYYVTNQLMTKSDLVNLGNAQWTDYVRPLTYTANQNVILYEKVVDKAGNTEYFSSENVVVDNVKPALTVTITPSSPAHGMGVYSAGDSPGVDIRIKDTSVTADQNAYAGLNQISYKIVGGITGYVETGVLASFDRTAHQSEWTGYVNINPELFYSNDVWVTVTASDWSTNEVTSETITLKVDNKAPVVKFSFDTSDALNGKYYKKNKTLTITVDERNFDTSYTPTVTSSASGGYTFSGWSSNGEIHTGTVTFSGDSDYTVTFDCVDLAGNKSNTENLSEFTVDKTIPVINVSYSNNNAQNGKYYKESRTATITIAEHNFNASEVRVATTASLNGVSITAPTISDWSTSGDRHTATIVYAKDGDFTFDITYSDLAGNSAANYAMDRFTVDLTNPEIKFSGVEDKSANKGTVAPVIKLTDTNFNTQNVTLTLIGAKKGKVSTEDMLTVAFIGNGQRITFQNFAADMDDIYTLTAKLVDKAGNETSKTLTFSVNRDGSNYLLDEATRKLIKSGFINKPQDIVITEVNVDIVKFAELSYSKGDEIVKLVEGKDFIVQETGGDGQWKQYTYTIKASCFEAEGDYTINIYSEDYAENQMTNKSKNTLVEFIVDKTAPIISIANLENMGRYKEDMHEFIINVKDNMGMSYVEIYLDEKLWHTYTEDDFSITDGLFTMYIDSKNAYQSIRVIAADKAGNLVESKEYKVLVTSNKWILFFMNKPMLIGVRVIVVIAVIIIIIFLKNIFSKKPRNL